MDRMWVCLLLFVCTIFAACPGAYGTSIPIVNAGFEDPVLEENGFSEVAPPGWTQVGAETVGAWNVTTADFDPVIAPEGENVSWNEQVGVTNTPNGVTQVLDETFAANTPYTLTAEVGNAWYSYWPGYSVQLLAGGTVIAEDDNTLWPDYYEWAASKVVYTYDPADAALVGQPLEIRLLNLGINTGGAAQDATFSVEFDAVSLDILPLLEIDRDSGSLTWSNNTGSDLDLLGYSIISSAGALDQNGWITIKGHSDVDGDGSIDGNDPWTVLTAVGSHADLSEAELAGGDGGTISNGRSIDLGSDIWIKSPTEDLAMQILRIDGSIQDVTVAFVGNGGEPFATGDLDFDGTIDVADWTLLQGGYGSDLSGMTVAEAYQLGDLTGDRAHGLDDIQTFRNAYDAANGAGAFARLTSVPEPGALALLVMGIAVLVGSRKCLIRR